jgi:tryptophanyl-tRNA synthetase
MRQLGDRRPRHGARRAEHARDLGYVRHVLRDGNGRANTIASDTLAEVRAAMGIRY